MADFDSYEGRQAFRDSHPGWIVDNNGAYNPYSGTEVNKSGGSVRDTGKEPNRGPAPIGNDQSFADLTPISGINKALNDRLAQVEQAVQAAMAANQISSGPANQNSFIAQTVANILKATQSQAAQLAKTSALAQFNPQASTAAMRAAGYDDTPQGRYQMALAQQMGKQGAPSLADMQGAVAPVEQAYQAQQAQLYPGTGSGGGGGGGGGGGQVSPMNLLSGGTSQGNYFNSIPGQSLGSGQGGSWGAPQGAPQGQPDILTAILTGLMGNAFGGTPQAGGGGGPLTAWMGMPPQAAAPVNLSPDQLSQVKALLAMNPNLADPNYQRELLTSRGYVFFPGEPQGIAAAFATGGPGAAAGGGNQTLYAGGGPSANGQWFNEHTGQYQGTQPIASPGQRLPAGSDQALAVGGQLNASPAAQQQYTLQPIGNQNQQSPRQIPGSLFQIPSTQLYGAFSPSEQQGLSMFSNGLGINNQDLLSQIMNLAPPSGYNPQSFLKPFGPQGY